MLQVNVTRHPKGRSVIPDSPEVVVDWIAGKPEGWRGTMTLDDFEEPRNHKQLRGLMGRWMGVILKELGNHPHEKDYIYGKIKVACGYYIEMTDPITGEVERVPIRTRGFSKAKYSQFMKDFQAFVEDVDAGFGIRLPDLDPTMSRI